VHKHLIRQLEFPVEASGLLPQPESLFPYFCTDWQYCSVIFFQTITDELVEIEYVLCVSNVAERVIVLNCISLIYFVGRLPFVYWNTVK
jgi:hypothetical protein